MPPLQSQKLAQSCCPLGVGAWVRRGCGELNVHVISQPSQLIPRLVLLPQTTRGSFSLQPCFPNSITRQHNTNFARRWQRTSKFLILFISTVTSNLIASGVQDFFATSFPPSPSICCYLRTASLCYQFRRCRVAFSLLRHSMRSS